jgi:hypothetical protein
MPDKPDSVLQVVMMLVLIAVFGAIVYGFVAAASGPAGAGIRGMTILIVLIICAGAALALSGMWRISRTDPKRSRTSFLRIVLGTFAVLMFAVLQPYVASHPGYSVYVPWQMSALTILFALVTLALYWIAVRAVCAAAKLDVPYWRRSLSRFPIVLVSFVVWQSLGGLMEDSLWGIASPSLLETSVAIIVPLVAAGVTYSLGVWLLVDGPRKEEAK